MSADEQGYNGWKNYETWAVGMYLDGNYTGQGTYQAVVELVAGQLSFQHLEGDGVERGRVASYLQQFVQDDLDASDNDIHPLASDLLNAALSEVDWYELSDAWIENVAEQVA